MDKDLALRVAWFWACQEAIPVDDHSAQLRALEAARTRSLDPCWTEMQPQPLEPGSGFFTITEAERRCIDRNADRSAKDVERILKDPAGYVLEQEESSRKNVDAARRYIDAVFAVDATLREARSRIWQACVATFPRYSAECTTASESLHVESPPPGLPREVLTFGR